MGSSRLDAPVSKLLKQVKRSPDWNSPPCRVVFASQIGGRTLGSIFREAGCLEPASPSCAACLGGPADTYARMNEPFQCVSTTNRNFPGRMGHKVEIFESWSMNHIQMKRLRVFDFFFFLLCILDP